MGTRIVKYILIPIVIFLIQCATSNKSIYKNNNSLSGMSAKEPESGDQIDQGKTYQVVFILKENEDCIGAGVSSQVYDESINDNTNVKTYFIIEKLLDLSRFSGSEAGYQYSEIGKNFDNNWNTKPEIQICSGDDPVSRLEKENKFRLRFTTFKNTEFKYNLIIRSRYGVIFQDFKNNN